MSPQPVVIAHRTCPLDEDENSLAGVITAARLGADVVEIDVRRCRGGTPVLMHDPTGWRTARWPWPIRVTSEGRVSRLRLTKGVPVPTLNDILSQLPDTVSLAVDVKDPGAMDAVIQTLVLAEAAPRTMLWCRRKSALRLAAKKAPEIRRALLRDTHDAASTAEYLRVAADLGVQAVSLNQVVTTPEAVNAGHLLGLTVYSWAQEESAHAPLLDTGIDGLVTDWPLAARRLIDKHRQGRRLGGPIPPSPAEEAPQDV
jgi:glycerophosphoryl diester phosphodiesterase